MTKCLNCGHELEVGVKFCPDCGTQRAEAVAENGLIGRTLNDKYRVLSELGSGAMGTVYLGEHLRLKKKVALKVLHPDLGVSEETIQRFQQEGIAAGRFSHPNAIQIFDIDRADDRTFYLAMEFVEGRTLKALLRERGRLAPEEAVGIVRQVLSVLAGAHQQGIVHRDLKPENIMVVDGALGQHTVKVLDFGLSKLIHQPLEASLRTQTGRILGTPLYMAPEQCSGEVVDHRSDLYATGLVLYEMLTGSPPFVGDTLTEILVKHSTQMAPSLVDSHPDLRFPSDLDDIVERSLAKRREDRYGSATEMLEAIDAVRFDRIGQPGKRPVRRKQRSEGGGHEGARRAVIGAVAVVLVAVALVARFGFPGLAGGGEDVPRVSMKAPEHRTEDEGRYVDLLDQARRALRDRATDAAMAAIEDALELPCRDSEAFLLRARAYRLRDDDVTALADYREALQLDAGYAEAMAGIGWLQFDRGDDVAAIESFEEAAGLDPDSHEALTGQAAVLLQMGESDGARELLERSVGLAPSYAPARAFLGRVQLDDADVDDAIDSFVQAKRHDSRSWRAYAGLGEAYILKDSWDEAETQLRRAVELGPDEVAPRIQLAALLVTRERTADARSVLQSALDRYPECAQLHGLLGAVEANAGETARALESLRQAVNLGIADVRTHLLLGTLLGRDGQHGEALAALDTALLLDDRVADAHKNRGLALLGLGRPDEAVIALERAVELADTDAFAHLCLGVICRDHLADLARARLHLSRYVELGGGDARVREWLAQ